MNRVRNAKLILWLIVGFAAAVALNRFIFGLGVTTHLSDTTPWGLWIGFDVMGGVALAAGGFVITAIFYVMKREEFHPIVKSAVLTAFLGYLAVILSLFFDLGLPWNIWHMIIYWNPHSPLFEVGWCVMLYTTVLLLEFSPTPLESSSRYARIRKFLMKFRFPLVLLGIMLSTLHQSSLGTLFLIVPEKLYALWYSHILPIEFFISAIALGLMMVAFETLVSHWLFKREPETEIISKLCRIAFWVLALYFVVRIADIIIAGNFEMIFNGNGLSILFIIEILISTVIPAIMFAVPKWTKKSGVQWVGSAMVVVGMVMNRMDVGGLAMHNAAASYIPSWTEVAISLGIVSVATLVFLFFIEHFHVWDEKPVDPESLPHTLPTFDYTSQTWLGTPDVSSLSKYTLAFVLSFGIGIAILSGKHLKGKGIDTIQVKHATGIDTLRINGNSDDQYVDFTHKKHIAWIKQNIPLIGKDTCAICHHLSLPGQKLNNCSDCHSNMYTSADFFRHDWHASSAGANLSCNDCHKPGETRSALTAKSCTSCHSTYKFASNRINRFYKFAANDNNPAHKYYIPSYADAMHDLCLSCHLIEAKKLKNEANLTQCSTCHQTPVHSNSVRGLNWKIHVPHFNNVILPMDSLRSKRIQEALEKAGIDDIKGLKKD